MRTLVAVVLALTLLGVARGQDPLPQTPPAAQPPARPSFSDFIKGIREEARGRGIRDEVLDLALNDLAEPLPVVIERDRAQAEVVLPLEHYLGRHVTAKVIQHGREAYQAHRALLQDVSARYGVPAGIIVSIWGIESNFGRFSGVRPTIAALATLAWDPRRSAFFRGELLNALEILNRGDIDLSRMRGSWAGAMGQVQFMPSSYLQYAEDFDGDGKRDIWESPADVFASIANYLKQHGWTANRPWGREVRLSDKAERRVAQDVARRSGSCIATRDMTVALSAAEWNAIGVHTLKGGALPADLGTAALVSGATRRFLVTGNYDALLDYNCAHSYALAVALLGEQIAATGKIKPEPKAKTKSKAKKPAKKSSKTKNL